MKPTTIKSIIEQAIADASANDFKGYDPYDALNTSWKIFKRGKWMPVLLIQAMKRNPINLRKILGIQPGHNPKALGLLLESCVLMEKQNPGKYSNEIDRLIQLLHETKTPGFSGTCWGYNFDWASPVKVLPKGSPTAVVTGFIAKGLYELIQLNGHPQAEIMFRDIAPFMRIDLPRFSDESGMCISYSTVKKDCCFNASLLAAGYFARFWHFTKEDQHKETTMALIDFVVSRQKPDGSWAYSIDLQTGKERVQTDFHQGFILDSISEAMTFLDEQPAHWVKAADKGASFYFNAQFSASGRSYFRLPRKYPTDIHHQAQGIITATRVEHWFPQYMPNTEKMVEWALTNMYAGNGRFYYRIFPGFSDKTNYLRWGQAWMVLALARWYTLNERND